MLPNAYSHCLFTVTVSDMKSRSAHALCVWWWWWWSAHAFMCVMVVVVVVVVCVCVCVCLCVCMCVCVCVSVSVCMEWVAFIAIAWDEAIILVAVHFSMKTFTSYVTGAEPWCGATLASTSVRQYLISNIRKTSLIWYMYRIIKHIWLII